MKKYLPIILFFVNSCLSAQAPQKFFTKFGGYGHDIGYGVIQTLNGQYAVTGSTSSFGSGNTDVYLALIDSFGWVRWERSYGGFNNDIGKSIIQLADSGFVIAGYTNSFGAGGYDMFVVRTDKLGNSIWQKSYGGLDWDFGNCVKTTLGGDSLIIVGNTYSFGRGKSDGYIVKTDLNGNFQWQKTYGGTEDDYFKSFVLTYNNLYAVAGSTGSLGDVKGDASFFKLNLNGDSVTSKTYGATNKKQFFNDLSQHPVSHDFVFCGGWDVAGDDTIFGYVLWTDENGNQISDVKDSYKNLNDEQFYSITYRGKNTDYAFLRRQPNSSTDLRLQAMVMMLNPIFLTPSVVGNISKYGSTEDDELFHISNTRDKGFIAVGYTKSFNANLTDVFLVKLDSTLAGASSVVGVHEEKVKENNGIAVFPTITNDIINIQGNSKSETLTIQVFNSIGSIVLLKNSSNTSAQIDLGLFSNGIYYIQIVTQTTSQIFKVVKTD